MCFLQEFEVFFFTRVKIIEDSGANVADSNLKLSKNAPFQKFFIYSY